MKTQLNRLDAHQPMTTGKLVVPLGSTVGQTFLSNRANLNTVSVCLRNPDRLLMPLTFTLFEATSSAAPLRTLEFSGGNLDNADCTKLQFDPIADSQGKTYLAQIKLATLPAAELPPGARPPYAETDQDDSYPDGTAYLNAIPLNLDLHFKTHYSQPVVEVVHESLTQFAPRFLLDPGFSLFYFVLLSFTLYLLLRRR